MHRAAILHTLSVQASPCTVNAMDISNASKSVQTLLQGRRNRQSQQHEWRQLAAGWRAAGQADRVVPQHAGHRQPCQLPPGAEQVRRRWHSSCLRACTSGDHILTGTISNRGKVHEDTAAHGQDTGDDSSASLPMHAGRWVNACRCASEGVARPGARLSATHSCSCELRPSNSSSSASAASCWSPHDRTPP
jgi:hypothetical protein